MPRTLAVLALGLTALGACEETMISETAGEVDSGLPSPAQSACMAAVANQTGNLNVTVLDVADRLTGMELIVGVGEDRAPWRCLTDSDGNVEQVTSMVGEGSL